VEDATTLSWSSAAVSEWVHNASTSFVYLPHIHTHRHTSWHTQYRLLHKQAKYVGVVYDPGKWSWIKFWKDR